MDYDILYENIFTNKDILLNILIHLNESDLMFFLSYIPYKITLNFWVYKFEHYNLPFSKKYVDYYRGTYGINRFFNIFNALLNRNNLNRTDCVLDFSVSRGLLHVVKFIIENGVDISERYSEQVFFEQVMLDQSFKRSVLYKHLDILTYLHEHGANIYVGDNYALKLSTRSGNTEISNYLIKNGATLPIY